MISSGLVHYIEMKVGRANQHSHLRKSSSGPSSSRSIICLVKSWSSNLFMFREIFRYSHNLSGGNSMKKPRKLLRTSSFASLERLEVFSARSSLVLNIIMRPAWWVSLQKALSLASVAQDVNTYIFVTEYF